jgi:GNAT superfamily N-acetyltransferase
MRVRTATQHDRDFLVEMARLACGLEDRPLPAADDPAVRALLPGRTDLALVAADDRGERVGAAWWHFHEPALVVGEAGQPLPEIAMAVRDDVRGRGIGSRLLDELTVRGTGRFEALVLNVHLRSPALALYMRSGFSVAAKGRGPYGVAMIRPLR